MSSQAFFLLLAFTALVEHLTLAIQLDISSYDSILDAAASAAYGVQTIYNGNQSDGTLGKWPYLPYYWWESGGAWGGMIDYWHYTGDQKYVNVTLTALVSQVGPAYDFVMPHEIFDEGNDDQAFWVFAALSAQEYGFPQPSSPVPSWLIIAENAWQDFVDRWNTTTCNGGLKWQFYSQNAGYDYRSSISNGAFFQISARLGRYTGNQTYIDWASKIWDWSSGVGLIDSSYTVFDGTDDTINCSRIDHDLWSYNIGSYLYGAAMMQNFTNGSTVWAERTEGLLNAASQIFFSPSSNATDVMFETQCEPNDACNTDQLSMKAYLSRWLAGTSLLMPSTSGQIGALLQASAAGAALSCTGFDNDTCGTHWYYGGFDNMTGLGQQLSAMEVFYALLVNSTTPPSTQPAVQLGSPPPSTTSNSTHFPTPTITVSPVTERPSSGASQVGVSTVTMTIIVTAAACLLAHAGDDEE